MSGEVKARLTQHAQAVAAPEQVVQYMRHFFCASTYSDASGFKVQMCASVDAQAQALLADACVALVAMRATVTHGPPPRSGAARAVQRALLAHRG